MEMIVIRCWLLPIFSTLVNMADFIAEGLHEGFDHRNHFRNMWTWQEVPEITWNCGDSVPLKSYFCVIRLPSCHHVCSWGCNIRLQNEKTREQFDYRYTQVILLWLVGDIIYESNQITCLGERGRPSWWKICHKRWWLLLRHHSGR